MSNRISGLFERFTWTGELATDVPAFLRHHGQSALVRHVQQVAAHAENIAAQVGVDQDAASCAAWLHDISLVLPYGAMVEAATQCAIDLLPEERQVPALIHGKLSAAFAAEFFGVRDDAILQAIQCHTTLRANPSLLDKVLFVADKLSWDPAHAPWQAELRAALERAIDDAVWCILDRTWQERERMPVIHPSFRQAHAYFSFS